jgi:hypothetical protein
LPLLHDMRQLGSEELLALHGIRLKLAGGKVDVVAGGESDGTEALGLRPDMHPHAGEIRSQRYLICARTRSGNGLPPLLTKPSRPGSTWNQSSAPCACASVGHPAPAGAGEPGGFEANADAVGHGGREAALGWIGGGAGNFAWTATAILAGRRETTPGSLWRSLVYAAC